MKVTSITTAKDGTKTYWYDGAEPRKRKPPVNRGGYRRDVQAARLYDAEHAAFFTMFGRGAKGLPVVDLPELADVKRYVAKVVSDKWFKRHFGWHGIRVQDGRGMHRSMGRGGDGAINIAKDSRCRWVVLHEITHCVVTGPVQHHGPEFVRAYLQLVRHFLGRKAWRALLRECKARKVKTQKRRRSRPISAEQASALVERLTYARAIAADRKAREQSYELGEA